MPDHPTAPIIAAQVTYTSNLFASPQFIAAIVTLICWAFAKFGLDLSGDPATLDILALGVGWALGAVGNWLFPRASGRLALTAPAPWSTPAPQSIPTGASVVTVPAAHDQVQVATVTPVDVGAQIVTVSPATPETRHAWAEPMTVAVAPSPEGTTAADLNRTEVARHGGAL